MTPSFPVCTWLLRISCTTLSPLCCRPQPWPLEPSCCIHGITLPHDHHVHWLVPVTHPCLRWVLRHQAVLFHYDSLIMFVIVIASAAGNASARERPPSAVDFCDVCHYVCKFSRVFNLLGLTSGCMGVGGVIMAEVLAARSGSPASDCALLVISSGSMIAAVVICHLPGCVPCIGFEHAPPPAERRNCTNYLHTAPVCVYQSFS